MDRFRQDLVVSLRRLRSSPGFTLAAILTLGLGIGANVAIFTVVNALLFRPLPVSHPGELVSMNMRGFNTEFPVQSYPNYLDFRGRNNVLAGLAGYRMVPVGFSRGDSNNARLWVFEVTGNYFDVLGVSALRGRVFSPKDDVTRNSHPLAVLTYATWQRRFGADPDVVGKKIKLNGLDYTIAGVTPQKFTGTEIVFTPEIFVPMAMTPQIEPGSRWLDDRGTMNMFVIGRLKRGVSIAGAEAQLNSIAKELGRQYPKENAGVTVFLSKAGLFGTMVRGPVRAFAAVLLAVSGLVLVLACVNLAGLSLARASDRRKESAIRLALGAAPGRLVSQLLTESVLLSGTGGVAGLLLAKWMTDSIADWNQFIDVPVIPAVGVDVRVLAFAAAASLLTGVLFGLAPALQSARAELSGALKGEAVAERLRRFHVRDFLVSAQVALSVVLLFGSVLVVRSLQHALSLNPGFDPRHAASISFDTSLQGYDETRGREFQRRVLEKVRALPGIQSAGLIDGLPLTLNWNNSGIFLEGKPVPKAADTPLAAIFTISPGYLRTAETKLMEGRDFSDSDQKGGRRVAIVNQAFARKLLPGEDPIGKRFRHDASKGEWREIVGVVEDGKYRSLGEPPMPAVFEPYAQDWSSTTTVVARSSMGEAQVGDSMRRAILELDPTISTYAEGSLTDQLGLVLFPAQIAAMVLGAFSVLALVLAATGVYGIMAYAVSRRTREIGIRMALGARPGQVLRTVAANMAILVAIGAALGLALAFAAGGLFSPILFGVSPNDPLTYAISFGLIALVACAACWIPARRAIGVDPSSALRTE